MCPTHPPFNLCFLLVGRHYSTLQDIRQITEQWACVPRAVEELAKFDSSSAGSAKPHKDLCRQAVTCKQIYELEYRNREDDELLKIKEQSARVSRKAGDVANDVAAYDSDDTIEMTEEEINRAYNAVASTIIKHQVSVKWEVEQTYICLTEFFNSAPHFWLFLSLLYLERMSTSKSSHL